VLNAGGLLTEDGKRMIWSFDRELRNEGNKLNPGSTADLVASSIMISLLIGKIKL
ncbi:MAG: triphosphoribosyl-dephospho-CoA synthase, partial [Candidatus Methanomethylicia archaeon]